MAGNQRQAAGFLAVVVDLTVEYWARLHAKHADELSQLLLGVRVLCNAYVNMHAANTLLVLSANTSAESAGPVMYTNEQGRSGRHADVGTIVERCIRHSLAEAAAGPCNLAAPIAVAMCRMHRHKRDQQQQSAVCDTASDDQQHRVLVLKATGDSSSQHLTLMNLFFAAQKQGVLVDTCMLDNDCALMQQVAAHSHKASDITGGVYHKLDKFSHAAQVFLTLFLPDVSLRSCLRVPSGGDVDYRPVCLCHNRFVDVGWVCSVCLSVWCDFKPICTACRTTHKLANIAALKRKKTEKSS